jgi:hypothetical protein
MVMHGRNGNRGSIELEVGSQQFVNGGVDRDRVLGRGFGGAGCIRLDGGNESDTEPDRLKLAVDTKMVAAKGAGSGDGNAKNGLACYWPAP